MNSVGSLDPAVFAADSVEALAALRNAENEEACLQSERTSMPSQYDAVHIMPVGTPSNPSERSEMSATPLLLHNLQSVTTDSDLSAEELLRSFRDSAVPNTPTLKSGIAAKAAAFANSVSDPTMMFPTAMRPTNPDSTLDKNLSTTHRTPTMSPVPGLTVGQERPNHNADDGDKSRDRMMDVTPALRQRDIETTTAVSRSHTPSSEEVQVRLLQSKIQEATNYLQTLQVKADTLESEKERYEREAVKLAGDIDATDADVKDLQAQKKDIEAQRKILQTRKNAIEVKIKQKKADICGIEEAKTSVERHITAKFREHISANCEVDKAVKRQRDLEKQLIDAEYEARLVRECPDPDLRHFVRNTTEDAGSNQLIDDAITGEVTIIDLDQIEKMLEQAKEGTSDNFKPESVKSEHKGTLCCRDLLIDTCRLMSS